MKTLRCAALLAVALVMVLPAGSARAQDDNTLVELMRTDVKSQKKEIIADNLKLTDVQSAKFWPIYNQYELELDKIYTQRLGMMKTLADSLDNLSDKTADALAKQAFKLESQTVSLKQKYYGQFSKAVGPGVASHFFQYENNLLRVIDLHMGLLGLDLREVGKH
jgi:Spy/CpxP family protein refolding chaperone